MNKPTDERVFPKGHENYDRIVYDRTAGEYYDRHTDLFLSLEELHAWGWSGCSVISYQIR
jgi:hypothetical protein